MAGCVEDPPQVYGQKLNVKPGIMVMQFVSFFKNFFLEQISASSLEVKNKQRREFNCELGFLQENIKRNKNFENLWGDVIIMMCLESKLDKEGLEVTRV